MQKDYGITQFFFNLFNIRLMDGVFFPLIIGILSSIVKKIFLKFLCALPFRITFFFCFSPYLESMIFKLKAS